MHNPIQLNKKTIMNLVEGHIITSNTIRSDGFPMVCEYVSKPEEREEQWKRIRQVSSGKGYVYESEASFLETLKFYLSHKTEYNDRKDVHPLEHRLRLVAYESGVAPYPINPCFNDLIPVGIVNILVNQDLSTATVMYSCVDKNTGEMSIVKTESTGIQQPDGSIDFTPFSMH